MVNGHTAVRSATYDLLLVAHSNRERISNRLRTIHDFHLSFLPAAAHPNLIVMVSSVDILYILSGPTVYDARKLVAYSNHGCISNYLNEGPKCDDLEYTVSTFQLSSSSRVKSLSGLGGGLP